MERSTTRRRRIAAVIGALSLGAAGSAVAQSTAIAKDSAAREAGQTRHQFSIKTEPLRGATFRCGKLTLRASPGRSIETTDADLRDGVARISISGFGVTCTFAALMGSCIERPAPPRLGSCFTARTSIPPCTDSR